MLVQPVGTEFAATTAFVYLYPLPMSLDVKVLLDTDMVFGYVLGYSVVDFPLTRVVLCAEIKLVGATSRKLQSPPVGLPVAL